MRQWAGGPSRASAPVLALVLVLVLSAVGAAAAQWFAPPDVEYENQPYNGRFTFNRVRFTPSHWGPGRYAWGMDLKWNHDYPRAGVNLARILDAVTGLSPNQGVGNILRLDDPELFDYPWAYLCEVGYWTVTPEEAEGLRTYMLKGGFVVVDDFTGSHIYNFRERLQEVLPGAELIELGPDHPIFHSFYDIDDLDFGGGWYGSAPGGGWPEYYGVFEDNDPDKRLMMIVNYNHDVGEYWEFADSRWIPIDLSNEAYKLGVNYVIYAMIH